MNLMRTPNRYYQEYMPSPQPSLQLYQVSPVSGNSQKRMATAVFSQKTPSRMDSSFVDSMRLDRYNQYLVDNNTIHSSLDMTPRDLSLSRAEMDASRRSQNTMQQVQGKIK
jgi:hypothetical protein